MNDPIIHNEWSQTGNTLTTRLSGPADLKHVETWRDGLYRAAAMIPEGTRFKMLIDLRGYEVDEIDQEVHKIQRMVLPTFLVEHNHRIAYFKLYPEADEPAVEKRSASCIAVAHVHHDCNKMDLYNTRLSEPGERFFCAIEQAEEWISGPQPV